MINVTQLKKGSVVYGANRELTIVDNGKFDESGESAVFTCIDLAGELIKLSNQELWGVGLSTRWLSVNGYSATALVQGRQEVSYWSKLIEFSNDSFIQIRISEVMGSRPWNVEILDKNFTVICSCRLNFVHELQSIVSFFS